MSSELDKRVEEFFRNYQDRGMKKWAGFYLSDHTAKINQDKKSISLTNYEPSAEAVFDSLIPRYIACVLLGAIVDSFAAEQAARRIAMENATDNATEMINNLSLVYNRARQAAITQEITEIVGGANAQE